MVSRSRGQAMVEFGLVISLLMFLVMATGQLAIVLHYRHALGLAAQEGAFEAGLVGHEPADGAATTEALWAKLEPGARPATVTIAAQGELVVVDASVDAPAILPVPFPPFVRVPVSAHAVHTVERFQPGSLP